MKVAPPRVTYALAAAEVVCLAALLPAGLLDAAAPLGGFVPARVGGLAVTGALPLWLTPLSATLLHAGLVHLMFNVLMLLFCGREDEVALGGGGVAVLYVAGAYAAAAGQYLIDPGSVAPMIGGSGAISALVGAYALLYGRRRPSRLPAEAARWLHIAWLAIGWVVIQALVSIASRTEGIAVAGAAHVGGFVAGLLLARPLLRWRYRRAGGPPNEILRGE